MNFAIVSPGMPHTGNTIKEKSLGGSETAAIQLAEALAKSHDSFGGKSRVIVFSPCEAPIVVNNVTYLPISAAQDFCKTADIDVLIVSRAIDFLMAPVSAKVTYLWCHDLALKRSEGVLRGVIYQVDRILLMSDFQKKQYMEVYTIPEEGIEVIRNGIDPAIFPKKKPTAERHKGLMVYAARPERGLENLIRDGGIMDKLGKSLPDVTLMVAHYDNTTQEMAPYYDMLWRKASGMSNVKLLGPLTKEKLYELYSSSWLYIYPTPAKAMKEFDEISCISAMEAAACGLPFLSTTRGALNETVAPGTGILIPGDGYDEEVADKFVAEVERLFREDKEWEQMSEAAYAHGQELSWKPVAKQILQLSDQLMWEKTSDPVRLYKHFYYMSDIEMCREMDKAGGGEKFLAGTERERQSIASDWRFTESPALYREQYINVDKGASVEHYPTSEEEPRWQVVRDFLRRNKNNIRRVLDYGCWIGHQTIRMANELPGAEVIGLEITQRNIDLAEECKAKHAKHGNVKFMLYDEMGTDEPVIGKFDLVFLNEVLEHVLDPYALINRAEKWAKQGGVVYITTPAGPWEAQSYKTFPWRCHLRHYEMNDLYDIFGKKKDLNLFFRPTGQDKWGKPLGHHYLHYVNDMMIPTGKVNVERKMRWQAPRETVSACMIAYNAESMLHRTLKSVKELADEIIIAIDPKTTDTTRIIAEQHGAKIIEGLNPIEVGFEDARNQSIRDAIGDWILWIDSDEELLRPEKVAKYLRSNFLNAYALQQHHLSVDPPMALKPDLPMRLFRNNKGLKFYGVVHEHPEQELNKGVGYALVLSDCWIAHDGYLTEDIRKMRFLRNIDLVIRDRKKYPERLLGKFLWLRDLVHLCRYRLERMNGMPPAMDADIRKWTQEAIEIYEENYIANPNDPMAPDAISYYSEANKLLGKGVPVRISIMVQGQQPKEVVAQFSDSEKAAIFTGALTKATISPFEGRYI